MNVTDTWTLVTFNLSRNAMQFMLRSSNIKIRFLGLKTMYSRFFHINVSIKAYMDIVMSISIITKLTHK